jgi:hypothetical protein
MKMAAALIVAGLVSGIAGPASAQTQQPCPTGAYPSVDSADNQACKRSSDQGVATTQSAATPQAPRTKPCPRGAYPTVDNGANVCRTFNSPNQRQNPGYSDVRSGCPMGMFPSVDTRGNNICKQF